MKFTWDEAKRLTNLRKHSVDFRDCPQVFTGPTLTLEDTRYHYREMRYLTYGLLDCRVVVIAHQEIHESIRIISARKALRHEQKSYFENSFLPD